MSTPSHLLAVVLTLTGAPLAKVMGEAPLVFGAIFQRREKEEFKGSKAEASERSSSLRTRQPQEGPIARGCDGPPVLAVCLAGLLLGQRQCPDALSMDVGSYAKATT